MAQERRRRKGEMIQRQKMGMHEAGKEGGGEISQTGVPTDTRLLMSVTDDRGDGKDSLLRQGLAKKMESES